MKVLILGSNGQLGSEISSILNSHEPTCYTAEDFDFNSEDEFKLNDNYDFVINAMAMTNTGLCESEVDQAYKLNATRVGEIARECHRVKATFIHFSTDYVFDGKTYSAYTENDQVNPVSRYGASKLAGEYEALMGSEKTYIFRISSLYGVNGNNFLKFMLGKAQAGEELKVVNDQTMSPTSAKDVARVVKKFMESVQDNYGIYHCSNEGKCTWYEFAQEFFKCLEMDVSIKAVSWKDFPAKLKRPIDSHMSIEKLKNYYPMPDWKSSLKEFAQSLEK